MKLLFDCHTFDVGPQGTTTFLAGLLDALPAAAAAHGQGIDLTCAAHHRASIDRFVGVPYNFRAMAGGFIRRNLISLPKLTCEVGTTAIVSQYVRPFRSAAPTVSVIHDVLFLDYPELFGRGYRLSRQLLFGWAARNSDVVLTVSNYSRDRIAQHFGLPTDRIDVLPNAVDVRAPLPAIVANADNQPLRLLYVSRFEQRKRQEWCVAAAHALAARGRRVELTLIGSAQGAYADRVRAEIVAQAASGVDIAIRSDVSQNDLDATFATTDLFLFPSRCEGFGIPVIEAAAHGIPCVVADNTAMSELASRYAGISVPEDDIAQFIAATIKAADRLPELRAAARVRAGEVREAYRWPAIARDFLTILQRRGVMA